MQKEQTAAPTRIPSNHPAGIRGELSALWSNHQQLHLAQEKTADALDTNTTIFQESFSTLEAQIHVTQRVLSDMACGNDIHYLVDEETGKIRIHYAGYLFEYFFALEFGKWIRSFCKLDESLPEVEDAQDDSNIVVFGG